LTQERDPRVYLDDILEAGSKAREFTRGLSYEEFSSDDRTAFAVIRALEIVGEAAKGVSPETRALAEDVPWKSMRGMRDKLIHAYAGVDLEVVWRTVEEDPPAAMEAGQRLRRNLDERG